MGCAGEFPFIEGGRHAGDDQPRQPAAGDVRRPVHVEIDPAAANDDRQGNPDAEGLWRFAGISDRMGFSFHNTLIELLVNIGWIGVCVFALVAIVCSVLLVRRVMMRPSLALCFWLSLLVYEFVRMPVEAIGTSPFSYGTVLLFAGLGVALPARRTAAARLAARRVSHYRMRLPRAVFQHSAPRPSRFSV